jgi:hypothetical protein
MSPTRIFVLAAMFATLAAAPSMAVAPPSAAASVNADGSLSHGIAVTSASHVDTGIYTVTFTNSDVPTACAFTASAGAAPGGFLAPGLVNVGGSDTAGTISVYTYSAKTHEPADMPFNVYVAC